MQLWEGMGVPKKRPRNGFDPLYVCMAHLQAPSSSPQNNYKCTKVCVQVPAELFKRVETQEITQMPISMRFLSHDSFTQWITELLNDGAIMGAATERCVPSFTVYTVWFLSCKSTTTKTQLPALGWLSKSHEGDSFISSWWLPPWAGTAGQEGRCSLHIFLYCLDL